MTEIIWTILVSLGGICIGSLLNTVVFRVQKNIPIKERSKCMKCLKPIHWVDKVPIVSFFNLKGRCRNCSDVISWQYPIIEMTTGILIGLLFVRALFGFGFFGFEDHTEWLIVFARDAIIACLLLIIFIYDYKYSIILDRFSVPAIGVAIVFNVILGASSMEMLLSGLLIGAFFAFQFLVSRGRWVGSGDIRMGLLIGVLFGAKLGIVALLLSYILGAFAGVFLIVFKKRKLESHVPFGTFMTLAMILTLFFGEMLVDWYLGML
ncbi:prepilin peptidase [Candidatus Uhrbacteria bacterium]|jgi:leader peptidase (prepilin peptidase) / N-methyltransferase|nr:prepilin peptidase [Candidatus Uhrbacteria bacterium]MBT7717297.1 prepilin peptidase [Candidatus Uhrbacteria bacterium]